MDFQQILSVIISVLCSLVFVCLAVLLGTLNFSFVSSNFFFFFFVKKAIPIFFLYVRRVCCAHNCTHLFHRHSVCLLLQRINWVRLCQCVNVKLLTILLSIRLNFVIYSIFVFLFWFNHRLVFRLEVFPITVSFGQRITGPNQRQFTIAERIQEQW